MNNGKWVDPINPTAPGQRGESVFISTDPDVVAIMGNEGIEYSNAYPDFTRVAAARVEIKGMTASRPSNFALADEALAKQQPGRFGTADDVAEWRTQNGYVWHEYQDLRTMDLVPGIINEKFSHYGGVGEIKAGATLLGN